MIQDSTCSHVHLFTVIHTFYILFMSLRCVWPMIAKRIDRVQRCVMLTIPQHEWLLEHPEINVSALMRRLLSEYITEFEQ